MTRFLGALLAIAVCIFVIAPLLIVVAVSVNDSTYTFFPPHGFSFRWYQAVLGSHEWRDSMVVSIELGLLTALASTVVGLLASLGLHRGRFPGRQLLSVAFLSPLVFPGILLGIALLYVFGTMGLGGSLLTLFMGHLLISLPYTVRLILGALPSVASDIEEAAATLGADGAAVLRTVTLPLIAPALLAGALFAFLASFDNVVISVFLSSNRVVTLPVRIFTYIEFSTDASVAAVSALFIALTLGVMVVLYRIGRFTSMQVAQ